MIVRVEIPATAIGALPTAEMVTGRITVLAQAVDARLYAAPLGCETEPVSGPCWVDCGQVGWRFDAEQPGNPLQVRLADAVQQAWADSWGGP